MHHGNWKKPVTKTTYYRIPFTQNFRKGKIIGTGAEQRLAGGRSGGNGLTLSGEGGGHKKTSEMMVIF